MDRTDTLKLARQTAQDFNERHGAQFLVVNLEDPITFGELRAQALKLSGPYTVENLYRACRGRRPSHAEAIKLGQRLGALGVPRRKDGCTTLWVLTPAVFDA